MAGHLEGDLLKEITNVQRLIHEFPKEHGTPGMSPYIDRFLNESMKSARNIENCEKVVEKLKKEIASLESDIESHNESLFAFSNSDLDVVQEMLTVAERKHNFETIYNQPMPFDDSLMLSLTGIHFDDFTRKPIGLEDGSIVIRQHLQGHCYDKPFEVIFDVAEVQVVTRIPGHASSISNTEIVVTQLQIKVEYEIEEHLKEFIKRCERKQKLQPFLKTYSKYTEWHQHRQRTYEHFKEAFHEEVSLPTGSMGPLLQFSLPGQTRIVFLLSWVIHIDENDEVHQVIDLIPKASSLVHDLDENGMLKSLPEKFLFMVKKLGLEKALNTLFKILSSTEIQTSK